jgi:ABC-type nitrate/sulfonate/bicarbonate transport system permease component
MKTGLWLERLLPAASIVAFIGLWEAWVRYRDIAPIYLPKPSAIFEALVSMFADGSIFLPVGATVLRILVGFAVAGVFGIACGLLMGMSRLAQKIADPWIAALYPLPKISLIPLLMIWLGTGEAYKIVISAITAFFPVLMSTYAGVRQVDDGLKKAAVDLGASTRQVQLQVILPAAVPTIVSGLQIGMGVTIILVIAAEMIGSSGGAGLGSLLINAGQILDTERVFAVLVVLAVLGAVIMKLQEYLGRLATPWTK